MSNQTRPVVLLPRFMLEEVAAQVTHLIPVASGKGYILQMVGPHGGEGVSSMAQDLSIITSFGQGMKTLLLCVGALDDEQQAVSPGMDDPAQWEQSKDFPPWFRFKRYHDDRLCVGFADSSVIVQTVDWVMLLQAARKKFDLVVCDTPTPRVSPIALNFVPYADICLIVISAEHTLQHEVAVLQRKIAEIGGNVDGVILNRRRFHVPKIIYDRM